MSKEKKEELTMAKSEGKGQLFVPHANVPGPARLKMARPDNSGSVNTDPMFMADRLAIINHVMAYSYLIDEGRWDDWYALFSDDFSFETTVPEIGTVLIKGMKAFKEFINFRYIIPGKTSKGVRRHTQGNVHVAEQTATTAKVRTYMFISSVPAANELHLLTSGTYNADLEKRSGKWIITRWYIEVDVPLSPSKIPEGFTEKELKWIPDPSTAMPGAGPVAVPVQGKVTLKNHPFSMGALYENAPEWFWRDIDVVIVDYLTDAMSAAAFLPEQCTTLPIPELPGYSAVKQVWAHYRDSSFGPYNEFMPVIPCLFKGQLFLHVPFIYVDNDAAMAGGREIGGWPKKMGDIRMDRFGNEYRCSFERHGERLASASMQVGGKLFSTPLPADKPVSLPYPYNLTLVLPPPTGKPQASVPLPTTTIKLIPGVGVDNPPPTIARLIGAPWNMKGAFYSGSGASIAYHPSEKDPLHKLPILQTLGAMYFSGGMTLALKDIKVLDDMLKNHRVSRAA
jgi:acetoacetate decarboxylase